MESCEFITFQITRSYCPLVIDVIIKFWAFYDYCLILWLVFPFIKSAHLVTRLTR